MAKRSSLEGSRAAEEAWQSGVGALQGRTMSGVRVVQQSVSRARQPKSWKLGGWVDSRHSINERKSVPGTLKHAGPLLLLVQKRLMAKRSPLEG
jgi:hypothetical protein